MDTSLMHTEKTLAKGGAKTLKLCQKRDNRILQKD